MYSGRATECKYVAKTSLFVAPWRGKPLGSLSLSEFLSENDCNDSWKRLLSLFFMSVSKKFAWVGCMSWPVVSARYVVLPRSWLSHLFQACGQPPRNFQLRLLPPTDVNDTFYNSLWTGLLSVVFLSAGPWVFSKFCKLKEVIAL